MMIPYQNFFIEIDVQVKLFNVFKDLGLQVFRKKYDYDIFFISIGQEDGFII